MSDNNIKEDLNKFIDNLHPDVMKSRLQIIGLYIAMYESMVESITLNLKLFFSDDIDTNKKTEAFKKNVLKFDKNSITRASMMFVKENGGISEDDYNRFIQTKDYRDDLTHNITSKLLNDFKIEPLTENMLYIIELCVKIDRWWFEFFEIHLIDKKFSREEIDNMVTGNQLIYKLLTDIVLGDNEKALSYYNEIKAEALKLGYIES